MGRRLLYAMGFLPLIVKQFNPRPHWIAMWLAYLLVLALRLYRRSPMSFSERLLHIYVVSVLTPIVALGHITNYGFRFLFPVVLPALGVALRLPQAWRPGKTPER